MPANGSAGKTRGLRMVAMDPADIPPLKSPQGEYDRQVEAMLVGYRERGERAWQAVAPGGATPNAIKSGLIRAPKKAGLGWEMARRGPHVYIVAAERKEASDDAR